MSTFVRALARLVLLPILAVAVAVLVRGHAQPGDGFSAGIVAGTGVALQFVALGRPLAGERWPVRLAGFVGASGLLLMLTVTFAPVAAGDPLLRHAPGPGGTAPHLGVLVLDTRLAFELGMALVSFAFTVGSSAALAAELSAREGRP